MIDIVFEPIAKFFGTHAKFIIGVIVNIILIILLLILKNLLIYFQK